MPRPKGSKNKVKTATVPTSDFAALIAEKAAAKESCCCAWKVRK